MGEDNWVKPELDPQFMYDLWMQGVVGYKEFRNWLANQYPSFEAVRDSTIDDHIDGIVRGQRTAQYQDNNEFPEEMDDPSPGAA